jgi:hypothetical protein
MGLSKRQRTGTYNASGSRMIVPGLGGLSSKIQNGDKVSIQSNNTIIFEPSPTPSATPPPTPTP